MSLTQFRRNHLLLFVALLGLGECIILFLLLLFFRAPVLANFIVPPVVAIILSFLSYRGWAQKNEILRILDQNNLTPDDIVAIMGGLPTDYQLQNGQFLGYLSADQQAYLLVELQKAYPQHQ